MKKKLPIILVACSLIFLLIFVFFLRSRKKEPAKEIKKEEKQAVRLIEVLPESERPVVSLTSRPDGRELTLEIENIKNIKTIEYELVYLTEGVQRGVIGSIDLKEGEGSITRKLLLGTCSRGVCRYDKNVTGGTLTITFRGPKTYKFIKDFKLEKEKGKTIVVME